MPVSRACRCCSFWSSCSCRLITSSLVAGVLDTTQLDDQFPVSLAVMAVIALVFGALARRSFQINRVEGGVLLAGFVAATVVTF